MHRNLLNWSCLPFLFCVIFNRLQCNHDQIEKGDNSNLKDCNAITKKIKKGGNPKHCNLLNWSCLPFFICAIALQSIKLGFPPFFIFFVIALQSFKLELSPFSI